MHRSPWCNDNLAAQQERGVDLACACAEFTNMLSVLLLLALILVLRFSYLVSRRGQTGKAGSRSSPCSTLVVLGSGGHTAEMLKFLGGMKLQNYQPRVYVAAESDGMSVKKVEAFESLRNCQADIRKVPRARQVLQSYWTSVFSTIVSVIYSIPLVFRVWPDLILCNGPGTCIPVCVIGYVIKFVGLRDVKLVYVESICRVQALSLSGKLLYYLADHLVVQWPELKTKYPRTTYLGRIM